MRIKRRLTAVFALAAATALGAVGVALAAGANSTESFTVTPKTGLGAAGKPVKLNIHTHTNYHAWARGRRRPALRLYFDKNILFNMNAMPKCNATAQRLGQHHDEAGDRRLRSEAGRHRDGAGQLSRRGRRQGLRAGVQRAGCGNSSMSGNQPGVLLFTRLKVPVGRSAAPTRPATRAANATVLLKAPLAEQSGVDHSGRYAARRHLSGREVARFREHPAGPAPERLQRQRGQGNGRRPT